MKYFISQPMKGLTEEEILETRERIIKLIKEQDADAVIIDSYFGNEAQDRSPLWCLGESIKKLSEADVVVFASGYEYAKGCSIEKECAKKYDITILHEFLHKYLITGEV